MNKEHKTHTVVDAAPGCNFYTRVCNKCGATDINVTGIGSSLSRVCPVESSSEPAGYRDKIVDRLVYCYNKNPVEVAEYLDTRIDRSGNLLGWLREEAGKSR